MSGPNEEQLTAEQLAQRAEAERQQRINALPPEMQNLHYLLSLQATELSRSMTQAISVAITDLGSSLRTSLTDLGTLITSQRSAPATAPSAAGPSAAAASPNGRHDAQPTQHTVADAGRADTQADELAALRAEFTRLGPLRTQQTAVLALKPWHESLMSTYRAATPRRSHSRPCRG